MKEHGGARLLFFLAIAFALVGDARGSFERLPGPASARTGGWVWDWPSRGAHRPAARIALGAPAAIPGLGWTHARARVPIRRWRIEGDAYLLGLDDAYHEGAIGLWCGRGDLTIGARRWDVAWSDGPRRGGWSLSAGWRARIHGVECEAAAQDLSVGIRAPSAPALRLATRLGYAPSSSLRIAGLAFRDPLGLGYAGSVRWVPLAGIAFQESIRAPDGALESGVELRAGGVTVGFWLEPSAGLGSRIGISCATE